jgi:hydroxymethylbilane synthase
MWPEKDLIFSETSAIGKMMPSGPLRIITRRSDLALMQTSQLIHPLVRDSGGPVLIIPNDAGGDDDGRNKEWLSRVAKATEVDNKKKWIHELEIAVEMEIADIAVHSAKDYPDDVLDGTSLIPVLQREDPLDCFISLQGKKFEDLPSGSVIGTKSKRRQAQILAARPDLKVKDYIGNVVTRINPETMRAREVDGIVLAHAGIRRLQHLVPAATLANLQVLPVMTFPPCVNQGILLAQCRSNDTRARDLLNGLSDAATRDVWLSEREVIVTLKADCRAALAVYGTIDSEDAVSLSATIYSDDGIENITSTGTANRAEVKQLGADVANRLLDKIKTSGKSFNIGAF